LVALLVIIVVGGVGSLMLLASATRSTDAPHAAPSVVAPTAPAADKDAATAYADARSNVARPRWTTTTALRRVGGHGIMFELVADEEVQIWRKRVRPVLSVRCVGRTTEVFVVTHSPANVEGNTRLHTVQLSFNDAPSVSQMWEHSVDHDALFAPDGKFLLHQIARAKTMSLTFTPFNAPPAEANFSVDGFDTRVAAAGKNCR
jgi:hypothetical protein